MLRKITERFVLAASLTLCFMITYADATASNLEYITLEEHWVSPALKNLTLANTILQLLVNGTFGTTIASKLLEIGPIRLENMTENGIRMQVISNNPCPTALDQPTLVTQANNELASNIAKYPDRFKAWGYLPMAYPDLAAKELERCVKELGFVGALIDNHLANGTYYDGPQYHPVWEMATALDVPIYIHPTFPNTSSVTGVGYGIYAPVGAGGAMNFPLTTAADLATTSWGFHEDTGLHFLRLYTAGVFAEFPGLKIVLGHMGEIMPFMLERADMFLSPRNTTRASLIEVWSRNVWITTAGFFSVNPLATIFRNTAIDRIMYSVDYPFSSSVDGAKFMASLKNSGMVTLDEWSAIAYGNAQQLLGI